jgi:hypothetical protein
MPEREKELNGKTRVHIGSGDRKTYITLNFNDDGKPIEAFVTGESRTSVLLGRMISISLRHGTPLDEIVEQLHRTGGYASEVGDVLLEMADGQENKTGGNWRKVSKGFWVDDDGNTKCPNPTCNSVNTIIVSDCVSCSMCGWSACS